MSPNHVLILGATAPSGIAFAHEALARPSPPKLTLYVRTPSKITAELKDSEHVRLFEGSLDNEVALSEAIQGVDAVVSFLGAYPTLSSFLFRSKSTPIGDSFALITRVMRANGVKRILALSTPAFHVPPEQVAWSWWLWLCLPAIAVPQGNAEMIAIGKAVAGADDLDWTVFRIPTLTNGKPDLPVAAGLLGPEFKGGFTLSRSSMGRWLLDELEKGEWVKGAPVLANC